MHARPTEGCDLVAWDVFVFAWSGPRLFLSLQCDFYCPSSAVGNECTLFQTVLDMLTSICSVPYLLSLHTLVYQCCKTLKTHN